MSGVYAHNKLCGDFQGRGEEELAFLEDEVYVDEALRMSVLESYDTVIENSWADFIKDFCI
ncbi:MAG: hypothetical protein LBQ90_02330 [Synergistaceae bacterium]|nr:hypothetical protein [Synergistaceae bacterium]